MKKLVIYNTEDLSMKPARTFVKVLTASLIMNALLIASILISDPAVITKTKIINKIDTIRIGDIPLTDSAITAELVRLGCVLPNVAIAQFRIESSHYTSDICIENKNLAGIKNSASPLVIGKHRDHCVYRSYRDCLKDYVRVQNKYLSKIDGHYAAAGGYVDLIKSFK